MEARDSPLSGFGVLCYQVKGYLRGGITTHAEGPREGRSDLQPESFSDGPYPAGSGHAEAGWNAAFDNLVALVAG